MKDGTTRPVEEEPSISTSAIGDPRKRMKTLPEADDMNTSNDSLKNPMKGRKKSQSTWRHADLPGTDRMNLWSVQAPALDNDDSHATLFEYFPTVPEMGRICAAGSRIISPAQSCIRNDGANHWIVEGIQRRCALSGCKGTSTFCCQKCNYGWHPTCFKDFRCK